MGPRPRGRGIEVEEIVHCEHGLVQWGRDRAVAELRYVRRMPEGLGLFNGAATARSRNYHPAMRRLARLCSLQWGRDRAVAELGIERP